MRIAYIDFQNITLGIRELGREIDRKRFFIYLKMKYKIDTAKVFVGYLEKNQELYNKLELYGYSVIFKKTYEYQREDGKSFTKGNVDTILTLEVSKDFFSNNISYGILLSGDGDFDVVIDFWIESTVEFNIILPNRHKIPQLFKIYATEDNPLIIAEDFKNKISKEIKKI